MTALTPQEELRMEALRIARDIAVAKAGIFPPDSHYVLEDAERLYRFLADETKASDLPPVTADQVADFLRRLWDRMTQTAAQSHEAPSGGSDEREA